MSQIVERIWQARVTDRGVRAAFIAGRVSGSGAISVLANNTLFVDPINGLNSSAVRGDVTKPYQTIAAAEAAAQDNDVIHLRPGTYTVTTPIGSRANLKYKVDPGVTVTASSGAAVWRPVAGGPIRVYGKGVYGSTGSAIPVILNPASGSADFEIECVSLNGSLNVVSWSSGTLKIRNTLVNSVGGDGVIDFFGGTGLLDNCDITGSTPSIRLSTSTGLTLNNCRLDGDIEADPGAEVTIEGTLTLPVSPGSTALINYKGGGIIAVAPAGTAPTIVGAPSTLSPFTTNQDDLSPGVGKWLRVAADDSTGNIEVTGIAIGSNGSGRELWVTNYGSTFNIILKQENNGSILANRHSFFNGADLTIRPKQTVLLWYDTDQSRWVDVYPSHFDLFATLASPTFTGIPRVPTAALGTNTTQAASTAFVRTEIASLVDSSPAALDTLNELAAALGDDPNFATTVTNSLALKAPLASPTFTGTPAAPTAIPGTNTTQIATTAFVQAAVSASSPVWGNITGTLSNQTDLNTALNLKAPLVAPSFTGPVTVTPASTSGVGISIPLLASQSGNSFQVVRNSDAKNIAYFDGNGCLVIVGKSGVFPIRVRNNADTATIFSVVNETGTVTISGTFEAATGYRANAFGAYYGVSGGTRFEAESDRMQLFAYLEMQQQASLGTPGSNSIIIGALDNAGTAEFCVKDEGGTQTQLSQHAFDAPDSMYDANDRLPMVSKDMNEHLEYVRYINESRMANKVQQILFALADSKTFDQFRLVVTAGKRSDLQIVHEETYLEHNTRRNLIGTPSELKGIGWEDAEDVRDAMDAEKITREQIALTEWTTQRDNWNAARTQAIADYDAWQLMPDEFKRLNPPPEVPEEFPRKNEKPVVRQPRTRKQMPKFLRDRNAKARK